MLRVTYPFFLLHNHFAMSKKLHLNMIQTIELHISFQLYQKYLFESTVLFTQYILTPVHPLNTIYQIIIFNILWVCWLLVYTCKPLLYTKKIERKVLPLQCPSTCVKYLIFRFTTVILITFAGHYGGNTFFPFFSCIN